MNTNRRKNRIVLILLAFLSAGEIQAQENAREIDFSNLLFQTDWGGRLQQAIKKSVESGFADPVIIIYKKTVSDETGARAILISPLFNDNTEPLAAKGREIVKFTVVSVEIFKNFKIRSSSFENEEAKNIDKLWANLSKFLTRKSKDIILDHEVGLVDSDEYYIFSTLRDAANFNFSGHAGGLIYNPIAGSSSKSIQLAFEGLLKNVETSQADRKNNIPTE